MAAVVADFLDEAVQRHRHAAMNRFSASPQPPVARLTSCPTSKARCSMRSWIYLTATGLASIVAIGAVSAAAVRLARRSPLTLLGEL